MNKFDVSIFRKQFPLLNKNIKNRKVNKRKVAQYARDMINNDFNYNGHTISISNNKILIFL